MTFVVVAVALSPIVVALSRIVCDVLCPTQPWGSALLFVLNLTSAQGMYCHDAKFETYYKAPDGFKLNGSSDWKDCQDDLYISLDYCHLRPGVLFLGPTIIAMFGKDRCITRKICSNLSMCNQTTTNPWNDMEEGDLFYAQHASRTAQVEEFRSSETKVRHRVSQLQRRAYSPKYTSLKRIYLKVLRYVSNI